MTTYIVRRLLGAVPLLLFISVVTYAMMALAPGGPVGVLGPRGGGLSPEAIAAIKAAYGLDKPWYIQYFFWLKELVVHGSLGTSFVDHRPVIAKVWEKLPITVEMVGLALVLTLVIALPIGIYAGAHRGSLADNLSSAVGFVFYGVPIFWLSIVLIDVFAVQLRWFPSSGLNSLGAEGDPFDRLRHLALPVVAIALTSYVSWMRYQRSAMIEAMAVLLISCTRNPTVAGMEMRSAWGRMMRRSVAMRRKPRVLAASHWPSGIASMLPRQISPRKAAAWRVNAMVTAGQGSMLTSRRTERP